MLNKEQLKPWKRNVALLVVHGIGDQDPGCYRQKVIDGLISVYGDDLVNCGTDGNGVVTLQLPMKGGWCRVHLYEVYWANMLKKSEPGSFDLNGLCAAAWYPQINLKERRYPNGHRKSLAVWLWTFFLVPLAALIWFGYVGVTACSNSWRQRNRSDQRSWVDRELDKSAGDVFTYIKSMRGAIFVNSPRYDAAEQILSHFRATLNAADNNPDVDEIQILAHSLGTVIAFHALTGQLPATTAKVVTEEVRPVNKPFQTQKPVTSLLTIGSPLKKILFFWPELITGSIALNSASESEQSVLQWTNFHNPWDPVSGPLRGLSSQIEIKDERVWAGGALTSHTIYETNKTFLERLTRSLTGVGGKPQVHWRKVAWQFISSPIETAGALFIFPLLMFFGVAFVFALLGVLPKFVGWAIEKVGMTNVGELLSDWGPLGIMILLLVWLIWKSRLLAKTRRGISAEMIVFNNLVPFFLKVVSETVQEGFGETQIEIVTRSLLDKKRSEFTFLVKSGEKPDWLDLKVRRVGDDYVFSFSGDKLVVESVRSALRDAWERLTNDLEAPELRK